MNDIDKKEGDCKRGGVVVIGPDYDEDPVERGHDWEPPGDLVDHDVLSAGRGELIDDGAK